MLGIADDEVADLLRAETDPIEVIACLNAAPLELALEEMRRDWPPLNPYGSDRDREQDQHARAPRTWRCAPNANARTTTASPGAVPCNSRPSSFGRSLIGLY